MLQPILTAISFPHDKVICYKPCSRKLECGHKCSEACYMDCKCPCDRTPRNPSTHKPVDFTPSRHPSYENTSPVRGRTCSRGSASKTPRGSPIKTPIQSPIKRTSGSPAQHPQDLVDLTPEAQRFRDFAAGGYIQADAAAVEAAAKERLRQLDEENAAYLFGDPVVDTMLTPRTNELKLMGTRQAMGGTVRNTYEGFFSIPKSRASTSKQEPSLLD